MIAYLRHLIFHDVWLKLFSLALAILVWVIVSFAIRQQGSPVNTLDLSLKERPFYNLPVLLLSASGNVRDFKVSPSEVEVTVQGDARIIGNLQSKDIRAMVDLTDIETSQELRKRVSVTAPPGVACVRVAPPEVDIVFPPKAEAQPPAMTSTY